MLPCPWTTRPSSNPLPRGRRMYFDDRAYDNPHVATSMSTHDVAAAILDEDGKGGYCFDRMSFKDALDTLGFFLGYMSDPLLGESPQECEERMEHIVILPE